MHQRVHQGYIQVLLVARIPHGEPFGTLLFEFPRNGIGIKVGEHCRRGFDGRSGAFSLGDGRHARVAWTRLLDVVKRAYSKRRTIFPRLVVDFHLCVSTMLPLASVHLSITFPLPIAFPFPFPFPFPLPFPLPFDLFFTLSYFPFALRRGAWRRGKGTRDAAYSAADESRCCCVQRSGTVGCRSDIACEVEFSSEADALSFESGTVSGMESSL